MDVRLTQALRGYGATKAVEPAQPQGTQWLLPNTTMFKRIVGATSEDIEWQPPFSIAPYSVTGILGRGGMGVVYLGIQAIHRRRVAIKILPSRMLSRQHRRRFQQEKELLQRLHHQGIVRVVDSGIVNLVVQLAAAAPADYVVLYVQLQAGQTNR